MSSTNRTWCGPAAASGHSAEAGGRRHTAAVSNQRAMLFCCLAWLSAAGKCPLQTKAPKLPYHVKDKWTDQNAAHLTMRMRLMKDIPKLNNLYTMSPTQQAHRQHIVGPGHQGYHVVRDLDEYYERDSAPLTREASFKVLIDRPPTIWKQVMNCAATCSTNQC